MQPLLATGFFLFTIINAYAQIPAKSEIVSLRGQTVYYEVYGSGNPLFLLHGYAGSSKAWYPYVDEYAKYFKVYLVDLNGHGRSGPFTGKLSIRAAAEELLDLIKYLDLEQIQGIGNSYGWDVLFQLALLDTQLVQSMIIAGACGTWDQLPTYGSSQTPGMTQ